MTKDEGMNKMTKSEMLRNASFVILASSLSRHSPATLKLGEGGSFVIRHC
jgi:hypothetical protein